MKSRFIPVAGSDRPAIVDAEDYGRVSGFRWSLSGDGSVQAQIRGTGRREYLHRYILGLMPGDPLVDHINRDTRDNRRINLRVATKRINALNAKRRVDNTSGYKGVSRFGRKWRAYTVTNGKQQHLGLFSSAALAAKARAEAT